MEGGHCSNLFELASGNKGAWPARSVSTCNKGNAIKIANMGRHASDISQGSRTEALQTARPLCAVGPTFSDFAILDTEGMCC